MRTNNTRKDTLIEVALLKYRMELSQIQIAERLNISTMQVSRLLEKARQEGIVKIEVDTGISTDSALEAKLKERYGLDCAIVVNSSKERDPMDALARAAATHIDLIVEPGSVVGIAEGRTIMQVIPHLHLPRIKDRNDIKVVQLTGGLQNATAGNPIISLHDFVSRFQVQGYFLNTPIYVPRANLNNYLNTGNYENIKELWKQCNVCLGSVGGTGKDFLFYGDGTVSDEQMEEAVKKGAVGNVFGRWIDENGDYVDCEMNKMVISLPPEILMTVPNRVLVTASEKRIRAVEAALKKKIYNICILTHTLAMDLV